MSVYTFVSKVVSFVHDLTGNISAKFNLIDIVFNTSWRDDNEFPIMLQCKLWPWLMAILSFCLTPNYCWGGRDRMAVGYITTYTKKYVRNQCLSPLTLVRLPLRRGVLDTTLCDKVCQWRVAGRWFSPGTPVSSTNNTDRHDITEIFLKVALNTITPPPEKKLYMRLCFLIFFRHITKYIFTPSVFASVEH